MRTTKFQTLTFLVVSLFIIGCTHEDSYERAMKKTLNSYFQEHLKDPSSLKDLEITYAQLTSDDVRPAWQEQMDAPDEVIPELYYISLEGRSDGAVMIVSYRAKNSFGAYGQDMEAFKYFPERSDYIKEPAKLIPLAENEGFLIKSMLYSPSKKEIK